MNKYFFFAALTGWMISIAVHLMALGGIDVQGAFPYIWVMHIGIFPVWLVAILKVQKHPEIAASKNLKPKNPMVMYRALFADAPSWMIALAIGGFIYAGINFFLFINSHHGDAVIEGGRYILESRGHFVRELTLEEYTKEKASTVRGFSGHWIVFYGTAAAILWPKKKEDIVA